jgi:hypothetical protein
VTSHAAGLRRRSSSKPFECSARRFGAGYAADRTPWLLTTGAAMRFALAAARTLATPTICTGLASRLARAVRVDDRQAP